MHHNQPLAEIAFVQHTHGYSVVEIILACKVKFAESEAGVSVRFVDVSVVVVVSYVPEPLRLVNFTHT